MKEYKYKINGTRYTVAIGELHGHEVHVEVNGTPYLVELDTETATKAAIKAPKIKSAAPAPRTETGERVVATPVQEAGRPGAVKSPLPGTIMSLAVKVGDQVSSGDTVCVLEAMKMENDIHCTKSGTVTEILVAAGDTVLEGSDLMIIA